MDSIAHQYQEITSKRDNTDLHVYTLGCFKVIRNGEALIEKDWGRDKAIQLFQYLITNTAIKSQHKETIIDRLWEEDGNDQDFKVAMHGINKTLEPNRPKRSPSKYILRHGASYQLNMENIWIDRLEMELLIRLASQSKNQSEWSSLAYQSAIALAKGIYLPNRIYYDWSTAERERLQIISLTAHMELAELLLFDNPSESIRLTQSVLLQDNTWEDAYRLQMKAYMQSGNRPRAIRTYQKCKKVLEKEYGIAPLPQTQLLLREILSTT